MNLRLIIAACLVATGLSAPALAQEQPWLSDRRLGEGIGYRVGDLELHPGLAGELGYDSNYYLRADDGSEGEEPVSVYRLRVTPSLSLSTLGQQRRTATGAPGAAPALEFRASTWLAYNEFFGASGPPDVSVAEERHLDFGLGAQLVIGPQLRVGGDLYADYLRTGEPSNAINEGVAFDRSTLRGGGGVSYRPGGGLFEWRLGGEVIYNSFEDAPYRIYDNYNFAVLNRGRWRFLPRTALLFDSRYLMIRYRLQDAQNDGDVVESRIGLSGLITNRFAFLTLLGWNSTFYEPRPARPAQNYDGFVGQGELKWFLLPAPTGNSATVGLSSIAVGYTRSYSNSYLGSFYIRDRGYANFSYFMGGAFLMNLEASAALNSHPESYFQANGGVATRPGFVETLIGLRLFGEYRFSDTLAANTTWVYEQRVSSSKVATWDDLRMEVFEENIEFQRWQFWIGARWFL